jgi:LPXTG-motif cell wall-anchored protein
VADDGWLPVTGSPVLSVLIIALTMIGVGLALLVVNRRRARTFR